VVIAWHMEYDSAAENTGFLAGQHFRDGPLTTAADGCGGQYVRSWRVFGDVFSGWRCCRRRSVAWCC